MSGICGAWSFNGGTPDIGPILAKLQRRGPDGTHLWADGPVALGHTLLATTPEALVEVLPLTEADSGCTITADARLDNREQLMAALDLAGEARTIGDGELILRAYLKWGEDSPKHLLGDFAFAIWDPRAARLFCARDHMGMRQLIYHHAPGRLFAFATEADALVAHPCISKRINEGRIADFLDGLEGIDLTSTFYENIFRLPPAHLLIVDVRCVSLRRYWKLTPGPELKLDAINTYTDAFLAVFTEAVRCRLRCPGPVASMLSGGLDSNSVVSVAARILMEEGRELLNTFSAVGPDPDLCPETRAIAVAVQAPGILPVGIDYSAIGVVDAELLHLTKNSVEPFDGNMTLVRAVYRAARGAGMKVVLDGVAGDVTLTAGNRVAALLRGGKFLQSLSEARAASKFHSDNLWKEYSVSMWAAFAPKWLRAARRKVLARLNHRRLLSEHRQMTGAFTRSTDLQGRRKKFEANSGQNLPFGADYRSMLITNPSLVVGRERYDRVAAQFAIEPRDPFLDIRLIAFCLSLPDGLLQHDGWPKMIMRRAMTGILPDQIIWRRGKEHLGWRFTTVLMRRWSTEEPDLHEDHALLKPFVTTAHAAPQLQDGLYSIDRERRFALRVLASWLRRNFSSCGALMRRGD